MVGRSAWKSLCRNFSFLAMFPIIAAHTVRHSRLHRDPCWRGHWNKTLSFILYLFIYLLSPDLMVFQLLLTGQICLASHRKSLGVTWRSTSKDAPASALFPRERTRLRAQYSATGYVREKSYTRISMTKVWNFHLDVLCQCVLCCLQH